MPEHPLEPLQGPASALFNAKRFAIASILYLRGPMTMAAIQRATGLSWGDLDSNIRFLERRGLVRARRVLTEKGPRTLVALTEEGVRAYEDLVRYLRSALPRLASEGLEADSEAGE